MLVFLPGAAEIARAVSAFEDLACAQTAEGVRPRAFALHGSLPLEAQRRILSPEPGSPARVIFATSIAETSLTVPRVRAVLDSGLARLPRFQARIGLNRLVTEREARDRADQRRGRAGRLGPGLCVRAWPAAEALAERTECELGRAELSALALEAAIAGAPRRLDLPWLEAPPEAPWAAAVELLTELGAVAADGSATALRQAHGLPRHGAEAGRPRAPGPRGRRWLDRLPRGRPALGAAVAGPMIAGGDLASAMEAAASDASGDFAPIMAEARRLAAAAGTSPARARPECLLGSPRCRLPRSHRAKAGVPRRELQLPHPGGPVPESIGAARESPWIVALDADAGAPEGKVYSAIALTEAEALAVLEARAAKSRTIEWKGLEPRLSLVRQLGGHRPGDAASSEARPERARRPPRRAARLGRPRPPALGASAAGGPSRGCAFSLPRCPAPRRGPASIRLPSPTRPSPRRPQSGSGPSSSRRGPAFDGPRSSGQSTALAPALAAGANSTACAPALLELPSGSSRPIDYGGPAAPRSRPGCRSSSACAPIPASSGSHSPQAPRSGRQASPGDLGPARLLEGLLVRGAQGAAGTLSEARVAGRPLRRRAEPFWHQGAQGRLRPLKLGRG